MLNRKMDTVYASDVLRQLDNVLIVTHVRPDGDALGAALGLGALMRGNLRRAQVLLPDPLPEKYLPLVRNADFLTEFPAGGLTQYDALIVLDCARNDRVAMGSGTDYPPQDISILNIDHHGDNNVQAEWSCVVPDAAATSAILVRIAALIGWKMTPQAATFFYLGIMTDTGAFRFSNTSPDTHRLVASLLENNADHDQVIQAVYFSKSRNQQLFEADMVQNYSKVDFDGRYAWAALPDEFFRKYGFSMRDGEMLIELLRELSGVKIAVLLYLAGGQVKVSLRSKDPACPVGPLARKLGGGGHEMAAGVTLKTSDLNSAAAMLREEVGKLL